MNKNQKIGQFGENIVIRWLIDQGYFIITRNVKTSYKEIDIVAKIFKTTVFIEVKTRTNYVFGGAEAAMSQKKLKFFKKAIMIYSSRKKLDINYIRADFVAVQVERTEKKVKIIHYKDIL